MRLGSSRLLGLLLSLHTAHALSSHSASDLSGAGSHIASQGTLPSVTSAQLQSQPSSGSNLTSASTTPVFGPPFPVPSNHTILPTGAIGTLSGDPGSPSTTHTGTEPLPFPVPVDSSSHSGSFETASSTSESPSNLSGAPVSSSTTGTADVPSAVPNPLNPSSFSSVPPSTESSSIVFPNNSTSTSSILSATFSDPTSASTSDPQFTSSSSLSVTNSSASTTLSPTTTGGLISDTASPPTSFTSTASFQNATSSLVSSANSASNTSNSSFTESGTSASSDNVITTTVTGADGPPSVVTITQTPSNAAPPQTVTETQPLPGQSDPVSGPPALPAPTMEPPQPTGDPSPVPVLSPGIYDAVINEQVYHLPSPGQQPVDILLTDGSTAQLFSDKVILHGQTLHIPVGLSDAQEISLGGQTITARPGESTQPVGNGDGENGGDDGGDDGGGGGGGGLFGALGGLAGIAGAAVGGVASIGKDAASFVSGTGGMAAGTLAGTLSATLPNVNGVLSSLNGIQQSLPVDQLTGAALNTFTNAQNLALGTTNWITSTTNMLQGFEGLAPNVQQKVRDSVKEFTKPGGQLDQVGEAMKQLEEFPWEDIAEETPMTTPSTTPTQSGTQTPTATSNQPTTTDASETSQTTSTSYTSSASQTTSTSSSSTSSSSSTGPPLATATMHSITSKEGTSVATFESFIKELDGGVGRALMSESVEYQHYKTELNASQVADLPTKYKFIDNIISMAVREEDLVDMEDPAYTYREEYRAIARDISSSPVTIGRIPDRLKGDTYTDFPELVPRALIPPQPDAPAWKKMISAPPRDTGQAANSPSSNPDYVADDSGGRGTTIYVIDDGFDLNNPDLAKDGRKVETFFVSNEDAFPAGFIHLKRTRDHMTEARLLDAEIGLGKHGNIMASIAAGKINGVAPNADLYLLKYKGHYRQSEAGMVLPMPLQPAALQEVLFKARQHIRDRHDADPNAKSVINMSWGIPSGNPNKAYIGGLLYAFIAFCDAKKIPIVVAAGNEENQSLDLKVPQTYGTVANNVITVGSVDANGRILHSCSPAIPGRPGSMSVFAPGEQVLGQSGTSPAAAVVSGLAAYFYSLPNLADFLLQHNNILSGNNPMKWIITNHAWTRVSDVNAQKPGQWANIPLTEIPVVYNLASGDPMHEDFSCVLPRAEGNNATCSSVSSGFSSTSTQSSSATSSPEVTPSSEATSSSEAASSSKAGSGMVSDILGLISLRLSSSNSAPTTVVTTKEATLTTTQEASTITTTKEITVTPVPAPPSSTAEPPAPSDEDEGEWINPYPGVNPFPNRKTYAISILLEYRNSFSPESELTNSRLNWVFYRTEPGYPAVCGQNNAQLIEYVERSKTKIEADILYPPWPGGTYEFTEPLYHENCEYKNDGTNAGILFCTHFKVPCKEDSKFKVPEATTCNDPNAPHVEQHPVVFCEWNSAGGFH